MVWKRKNKLPRYHPENLQEGESAEIITGYETYIEKIRTLNFYEDVMGVEIIEQGPCDEGIDRWYIITQKRPSSAN